MTKIVTVTPKALIKHQGEKLYPLPYGVPADVAEYFQRVWDVALTPDAEPVEILAHLTVPVGVVNNVTGKKVFEDK